MKIFALALPLRGLLNHAQLILDRMSSRKKTHLSVGFYCFQNPQGSCMGFFMGLGL
jgi:hypothetical protein